MLRVLRYRHLWLGAGVAALCLILLLSMIPMKGPAPFDLSDKLLHFLAFVFLTLWFMGVFVPAAAPRIAAALAGYGLLIELLQSLTPTRMAEPLDVVSDLAGILAGWALAAAGLHQWCGRLEALIGVPPR